MMGGKINVESQYGQGSIFMATIPQRIGKVSSKSEIVLIHQGNKNNQDPKNEEKLLEISNKNVKENFNENINSNRKILIVDDNKLNIKVAQRAIEPLGYQIDTCENGQDAVNKVKTGHMYDVILMDIMMPVMSGETALNNLKQIPNFNIPVIALTADAVAGAKEKYISEGFRDYIAKPFSKDQIKEKLDVLFKNSSESNQNDQYDEDVI